MGDTLSATSVLSEESKEEIKELMNSRKFYVGPDNKVFFQNSTDVIDLTLANMTN